MKGKTKAVGGNPTGAGAKQFTDFLTQGLSSGSFGGGGMPFGQNAIGQTQGMGGAINQLLSGNVGDPMTLTNYFGQGNGMAGFGDINNNFQAPQFQNTQFNQAPQFQSAYSAPQFQGASAYNNPNFINSNLGGPQNIQAQQIGAPNFQGAFDQVNQANPFSIENLRQVMGDELNTNINQQRASLAGTGTGFMSSAGALGEALLRRDAPSRMGLALNQIGDTRAQQALGLLGLQNQAGLGNAGNALQAAGMNQQTGMGFNDQMLNAANMQNLFNQGGAQFGANLGMQNAQMGNQFGLNNAGQQAQFAQGAAGMNMDFMSQLNQLMSQQGGMQNQFNQSNAQFGAGQDMNAQMQNQQAQLQNQQLGNQYNLGRGNMFQGFQGNQLNAQQNMMGQLFNAFNQLNAMGTPQAQMVQQKSPFEQITGAVGNIAGGVGGMMMGRI